MWQEFLAFSLGAALVAVAAWRWGVYRAKKQSNHQRRLLERTRRAEKLAELGTLTGHLAHEIRNPLSIIKINLQLLAENITRQARQDESSHLPDGSLEESQKKYQQQLRKIETIIKEADRLAETLNDFLNYTGRMELNPVTRDVNELFEELVDFYEPQALSKQIQIRLSLSKKPALCSVDTDLLKQAILNLFINATQAMKNKGELIIRSKIIGDEVHIEIIDTGPGISPENQNRIFDPYYTTRGGGTGLGLPTCRRVVEEHNGHIILHSEPGKGSNFTIVLPLQKD